MKRTLLLLIALLLLPASALAQKTDVLILENGDRITGEIKKLEAGLLRFSTDSMGTVNIEWRFVRRVISDKTQSIELTDGRRILGSLQRAGEEEGVIVHTAGGTVEIAPEDIISAWPVQATFKDRIDLDVSVGFDYQASTEIANLSGAVDFRSRQQLRMTEASFRSYLIRNEGGEDQQRLELRGVHERLLPEQRFRDWLGAMESNQALGLDLRITAGAAFGKYFLKTSNQWFSMGGGLLASEEKPREGDTTTNIELVGNIRYRYFRFADPERTLDVNFSVFPSLTDSGRYRSDLRTTFKLELIKDLFWALELYGSFDNQPVSLATTSEKLDYGITTSFGWSY